MSEEPSAAFSIFARSHRAAAEIPAYCTTSPADAPLDALVHSNDQPTYDTGPHADMDVWEWVIRFKAAVFSAMFEDRIVSAYTPTATLDWKPT